MEILMAASGHRNPVFNLICELENAELDRRSFDTVYDVNLQDPNVYYMIAVDKQEIIGFASLHIQYLLHHTSKVAEIQELIISQRHRGCGVGSRLFKRLSEIAWEQGCTQLEVCCNQKRVASHAFYRACSMTNSHYKFTLGQRAI